MTSSPDEFRVLVVAGDSLARAGLAALLAGQPGWAIAGQIAGDADVSDALDAYRPDVVVWDLGWDPVAALELLADLEGDRAPVVALLPDQTYAAEARAAGARGLLLRDVEAASLAAALAAVVQGLVVHDQELSSGSAPGRERELPTSPAADLTPRELEVLQHLAEGLPNKAIAGRLSISEHTVKFHVNAIMSKLGAQSRTEAVTLATRLGLILL